jgi:aldehyde dehydrogenase (NAD+)
MISYDKHYYDGAWRPSTGTETIAVISSATEAEVARVPRGTAEDVDRAVTAARRGFDAWSRVSVEDRAQWLEKLSDAMKTRVPQIAEAISHEVGTALGYATKVQVEFPISMIAMNAKFIRDARLEEELGNSIVFKEPIGAGRRLHRGIEARGTGAVERVLPG